MFWDNFKEGFKSAVSLFHLLMVDLPLVVFLTVPAYCVGYAWPFVRGGFLLGHMTQDQRAKRISELRAEYKVVRGGEE